MPAARELENLLRLCRATMPGVAGVVLSSPDGAPLAHERGVRDPLALSRDAARTRAPSVRTSALVPRDDGLYLVVFVPPRTLEPRASSGAPAVPAA